MEKVAQKACMRRAGTSFFPIELCPKDRLSGNASPRVKIWRTNSILRETFSNGQYPVANMDLSKGWSFKTSSSWVKRMFTGYLESCGRRGDGTGEHESWCHHLHWYFVYWTIFSSDNFLSFYIGPYFHQTIFYLCKLYLDLDVMIWIGQLKSCQYCTYYSL